MAILAIVGEPLDEGLAMVRRVRRTGRDTGVTRSFARTFPSFPRDEIGVD